MKNLQINLSSPPKNDGIVGRQIAFFAAFLLPVYKLLELPSLLSGFVQGDLLLPAFLQFLVQAGLIALLLYIASRSEKPLFRRLEERLGKWSAVFYALYALFYLFYAILPLLDLEKFVYAAFYDTAPTLFAFAFFFLLSGFVCTKGIKSVGRSADLCLFLFLVPFLVLIFMSLSQADASNLLPFFEKRFERTVYAINYTTPHFSDFLLLLPLIGNLHYKKRDGLKITLGYTGGALCVLLFLGVFYSVYSTIAPREHYAFLKIAQYFPALTVIGRIDLVFVYMLCVVLFFYGCIPLQFSVDFLCRPLGTDRKTVIAVILNIGAFIFVLFCNQYYNAIYAVISGKLSFVFWISWLIPFALALFFRVKNKEVDRA